MKHLFRAGAILSAILILLFIGLRVIPVPAFLAEYGFHPKKTAENMEAWSALPIQYAQSSVCIDCHQDKYGIWEQGNHKTIGCENCHGPMGTTIYDHDPQITWTTRNPDGESTVGCANCHAGQFEQWQEAGHGLTLEHHELDQEGFDSEWGRGSCAVCHTSEGYIGGKDDAWAGLAPDDYSIIGCIACHDPHSHANDAQLRGLEDVEVQYDAYPAEMTGYGAGQLCAQCHHARRDVDNVMGQIFGKGSSHFGPHGSPQMDMFLGAGSYEIPGVEYVYDRGENLGHQNMEQGCVSCHMTVVVEHERDSHSHTFTSAVETCTPCHGDGNDEFDISGKQTEITALMEELLTTIGVPIDDFGDTSITTSAQREAAYAYKFVQNDGSYGVHNFRYAKSLLTNAIDYLENLP